MAYVVDKTYNRGPDKSFDRDRFAVVPSDTVPQPVPLDAIYVGGAGNITIKDKRGNTLLFTAPPVGSTILVGGATYVMATGTTATALVGIIDASLR